MARIPYPEDAPADLVESQRPDSLPEKYSHLNQQAARNVYRSVAHEPELVRSLRAFLSEAWGRAGLDDRQRELLILSVSRAIDSEYEWHQHVRISLLEGLEPEEILAVAEGELDGFTEVERAVMEFSRAAATFSATDEQVERLGEHFSVPEVAGMTSLVSAYVCLGVVLSALDVETEEPFVGWDLAGLERD